MQSPGTCSQPALRATLLLVFLLLLAGCAAGHGPPRPHVPEVSSPGGASAVAPGSLQAFAAARAAELTPSLRSIFAPPQGLPQPFFLVLSREVQETPLADRVLAHATADASLAFAREDGGIGIVSSWPCHSLALPGGARAVALSLAAQAGRLAALDEGNHTLRVFDLTACGELAAHATPTPVATMALSPDGQSIGYADAAYGLWAGPAIATGQGFANLARLRFITLDVGFSPRCGLLVVVDQVGWITVWKLPEGQILKTLRLPGGPFQEARISGGTVLARTVQGQAVAFDLASASALAAPSPETLTLREGVLLHTGGSPRLHRRLRLGTSPMQAWLHEAAGVLTLRDVDGQTRSYTVQDGRPTQPPGGPGQGQPVTLDGQYIASHGALRLQVAFPLYKTAGMTLYCRQTADEQYLLWWEACEHPAAPQTPPPGLPRLSNVFGAEPAGWIPLD